MIIECPGCSARYHYDPARFEGKPSKKIRCAKCQQVFEIHNPGSAPPPPPEDEVGDMTMTARRKPKIEAEERPVETATAEVERSIAGIHEGVPPRLPEGWRVSLAILDGSDAGKVFYLEKPRIVIGRSSADLTLDDAELSRAHAAVEVHESTALLRDLGSTNGTFFEGEKISEPVELHNRAEFQVGSTTLMYIMTPDE